LERAGIKPAATTDEIFHGSDDEIEFNTLLDNEEIEEDKNSDNLDEGDSDEFEKEQNASVSAGRKKRASKSKGSVGKGKSKTPRKNKTMVKENDGFSALLMSIARRKDAEMEAMSKHNNSSVKKIDNMVHLMESWKTAREAMGCPIKAAYACSEFEQFLDRKEKKQLRKYRREMESALSSDSSEED
jgi:hypothetical protein